MRELTLGWVCFHSGSPRTMSWNNLEAVDSVTSVDIPAPTKIVNWPFFKACDNLESADTSLFLFHQQTSSFLVLKVSIVNLQEVLLAQWSLSGDNSLLVCYSPLQTFFSPSFDFTIEAFLQSSKTPCVDRTCLTFIPSWFLNLIWVSFLNHSYFQFSFSHLFDVKCIRYSKTYRYRYILCCCLKNVK